MSANRQYKSSVFTALFDAPDKLISLYNAVTSSRLALNTSVKIATLEDVLFNDRQNDLAFVLDGKIVVLAEHQSTISKNLPLRLLIYVARVYEKLVDNDAVYMRKLLKIPQPNFIVLYNGTEEYPDEETLRLSDAYDDLPEAVASFGGSLELTVRVVNINEGRNEDIVKKSVELYGYVRFIGKVRTNLNSGLGLGAAVTQAVKDCEKEGILADFLKSHSSEVINMLTAEWNIERAKAVWQREAREEGLEAGREEGWEAGREEGREEGERGKAFDVAKKLLEMDMPLENISRATGLTVDEIEKKFQLA